MSCKPIIEDNLLKIFSIIWWLSDYDINTNNLFRSFTLNSSHIILTEIHVFLSLFQICSTFIFVQFVCIRLQYICLSFSLTYICTLYICLSFSVICTFSTAFLVYWYNILMLVQIQGGFMSYNIFCSFIFDFYFFWGVWLCSVVLVMWWKWNALLKCAGVAFLDRFW
jgi:hypothetical protein